MTHHEPPDPTLVALHREILQNPAEDTPRLVFADRLDELGGKHFAGYAKFIRLSIKFHTEFGRGWETRGVPLDLRWAVKTFKRQGRFWSPQLVGDVAMDLVHRPLLGFTSWFTMREMTMYGQPGYISPYGVTSAINPIGYCSWLFERGWISRVVCHWDHWEKWGTHLVACAPIASVELTTFPRVTEPGFGGRQTEESINAMYRRVLLRQYPTVSEWTFPEPKPKP